MSKYEPRVRGSEENGFFAVVVRIDNDGQESVIHGYKGRHLSTREAAIKSATNYIKKHGL